MKNIHITMIICTACLIGFSRSNAQSITPMVQNSAGGYVVAHEIQLSSAIGELAIQTLKTNNGPMISQGLLQWVNPALPTGLVESTANPISFYPNPVTNILYLKSGFPLKQVYLYNALGTAIPLPLLKDQSVNMAGFANFRQCHWYYTRLPTITITKLTSNCRWWAELIQYHQ